MIPVRSERDLEAAAPDADKTDMRLDFNDLTYDVELPGGETKRILHGITGSVQPGELLAVMGPTGAGKSSLLNILTGRVAAGTPGGEVLLNGRARSKDLKRFTGYVSQVDVFLSNLTVRETLLFAAKLRLPATLSLEQKRERVEEILRALNLGKVADSRVGGFMEPGISGGEKRRLSIGSQLVTNPSLLVCDEPTSGLDSATAHSVVDTLIDMARTGRAVVATLHQPTSMMFAKFDKLLLLAEGRTIYYGPAAAAADYFERRGYPCPRGYNIADHMLELVTAEQLRGDPAKTATLADEFERHGAGAAASKAAAADEEEDEKEKKPAADSGREAVLEIELDVAVDDSTAAGSEQESTPRSGGGKPAAAAAPAAPAAKAAPSDPAGSKSERWATPWGYQFKVLLHRSFIQGRGEMFTALNFWQYTAISLVLGLVWFQIEESEEELIQRTSAVFYIGLFWGMSMLFAALMTLPSEAGVVSRERASGSYRLSAYFVARLTAELPVTAVYPTISVTLIYWLAGLRPDFGHFLAFLAVTLVAGIASAGVGILIAVWRPAFKESIAIASVLINAWIMLGGFYAPPDTIPVFIRWIQWTSPVKYAYALTSQIEFRGRTFTCASPSVYPECATSPRVAGETILAKAGLDDLSPAANFAALLAFGLISRYAAYRMMRRQNMYK